MHRSRKLRGTVMRSVRRLDPCKRTDPLEPPPGKRREGLMELQWSDYDLSFIRDRYNQLARFFVFFEWLFLLPPGIRRRAIDRLELKAGDRVLEVGCGTGRNLSLLREAVGPEGHVYGIDLSDGMLAAAQRLCVQREWDNVTLIHGDAAQYVVPELVDGLLFSL